MSVRWRRLVRLKVWKIRESAGEEFRGYNRELLLVQLKSLKNKAKLP